MNTFEYLLPDLGEGIGEVEIIAWHAQPGERVVEHAILVEVQTDKAIMEMPVPVSGVLLRHGAPVGGVIKLGEAVAVFDTGAAVATAAPATNTSAPMPSTETIEPVTAIAEPATPLASARRALAAPAVRQLARELNVVIGSVAGSGPGGRVLREDVQRAAAAPMAETAPDAPVPIPVPTLAPAAPSAPAFVHGADESTRVPLRGLRRRIAQRMSETLRTVPHVTGMQEVDVEKLGVVLRELQPAAEKAGVRLTWTALFALATIQALKDFPALNAYFDAEREEIIYHRRVHLGLATASKDGLLVPVIRNADQLSLLALAAEIHRVGEAARQRTAKPAELTGSTYTLTNYGAVGGWYGTPMVNLPEIGIAGFGRVERRPVVVGDAVVPRTVVALSTTVDHRLIDGAVNAQFGAAIRRRLETPSLLMLGVHHGHG